MYRLPLITGILLLLVIEIARVYFIMPFPGSQQADTIGLAYFIGRNKWLLRIIGILLIAHPVYHTFSAGTRWKKILLAVVLAVYGTIYFFFNFRFEADKMFYQPVNKNFATGSSNTVDSNKLIIGVVINGEARAFPIQIIGYHHQVRDTIGNTPVMITYCTVCRTGRVYRPEVNGQPEKFRLVGSGTESGMRTSLAFYLDDVSTLGREGYHFSASEPRYVTDLLGADAATLSNSNFYITTPWGNAYRVIKNANLLIQAAANSTLITDAERSGYYGFARTIKAYQLLLNFNLTDTIRLDVSDPNHLGPLVGGDAALTGILAILDSGKNDLSGATVSFPLSSGFSEFNDAAGLEKFNRALAARVDAYLSHWSDVLTALSESFYDLNGDFNLGVSHAFSTGTGDQINPMFSPQNQTGEIRVAHPSYAADITAGDDRIAKATMRNATASLLGLSSNRDVWVYTSSTGPAPIIRNEELILLYAEANIQNNNLPEGVKALNVIRNGHHLPDYSGAVTTDALIDELLYNRRYSLFFEGHRWIDVRRYNRLNDLPLDRPGDDIWSVFPLPVSE